MRLNLPAALAAAALLGALTSCQKADPSLVQGYVEGEFVYVASPFGGRLDKLSVQRGDQVKAGQVLFALDAASEIAARDEAQRRVDQARAQLEDAKAGLRPTEMESIRAQLEEAKAALVLAEIELERQTKLLATRVTSQRDVDIATAARNEDRQRVAHLEADLETGRLGARSALVEAAEHNLLAQQAALARAEWNLDQKQQDAHQDALVSDTLYREGDWVAAGSAVVVLLPPQNLKVRAFVPQDLVGRVQIGAPAQVVVDGVAEPYPAKVTYIAPRAEFTPPVIYSQTMREKFVFLIELSVTPDVAGKLHPGQPVDVRLQL